MAKADDAAEFLWRAHRERLPFANLSGALAPDSIDEAYEIQEAFHRLLIPAFGPIAGVKIATTTKVMQALMGIDHPCGGAIFASRVFASPAAFDRAPYMNPRGECEIAVRLGRDLTGANISAEDATAAVSDIAPAFEIIEDRKANYRDTRGTSLIADNAWNGGVVTGAWKPFDAGRGLGDVEGVLTIDGVEQGRGKPDDPFGALAWLANLCVTRGRPIRKGMLVITGSLIPTFDLAPGADVRFSLGEWGEARVTPR